MQSSSMQEVKKEFKVGQKWKTRSGFIVEIESISSEEVSGGLYPIRGADKRHRTNAGSYFHSETNDQDLVELIEDVASEDKQDNKYSVEEVITTLLKVSNYNLCGFIPDIKKHLSKTKDPEYQKYLELKAKFE